MIISVPVNIVSLSNNPLYPFFTLIVVVKIVYSVGKKLLKMADNNTSGQDSGQSTPQIPTSTPIPQGPIRVDTITESSITKGQDPDIGTKRG